MSKGYEESPVIDPKGADSDRKAAWQLLWPNVRNNSGCGTESCSDLAGNPSLVESLSWQSPVIGRATSLPTQPASSGPLHLLGSEVSVTMEPGPCPDGLPPEAGDHTCSVVQVQRLDLHPDILDVTEYGKHRSSSNSSIKGYKTIGT